MPLSDLDERVKDIYSSYKKIDPNFILGCYLDPSNIQWIPEERARHYKVDNKSSKLYWTYLVVQSATSSISRCRICGAKIPKNELRIGKPLKDPRGDWGVISSWQHIACSRKTVHLCISDYLGKTEHPGDLDQTIPKKKSKKNPKTKIEKYEHPGDIGTIKDEGFNQEENSLIKSMYIKCETKENISEQPNSTYSSLNSFSLSNLSSPRRKILEDYNTSIPKSFDISKVIYGIEDLTYEQTKKVFELSELPGLDEIDQELGKPKDLDDLIKRVLTEEHEPPHQIVLPLLTYQREGLAWMCHQEESDIKGGILADEMGMGKTLQMICLFLARRLQGLESNDPMKIQGTNLVIAPLAAILQWKQEIERYTRPKSLNVLIYHGNYRDSFLKEIAKYDVVITTYSTIESDYRRVINKHKVRCKYCKQLFLPDKLRWHQTYFCGPEAEKTAKQSLQKVKSKQAAHKAMKTLNISNGQLFPNLSNVYKELLIEANKEEMLKGGIFFPKAKNFRYNSIDQDQYNENPEHLDANQTNDESQIEHTESSESNSAHIKTNQCDPDDKTHPQRSINLSRTDIAKLKVYDLKSHLKSMNLKTNGLKVELVERLLKASYKDNTHSKLDYIAIECSESEDKDSTYENNLHLLNSTSKRNLGTTSKLESRDVIVNLDQQENQKQAPFTNITKESFKKQISSNKQVQIENSELDTRVRKSKSPLDNVKQKKKRKRNNSNTKSNSIYKKPLNNKQTNFDSDSSYKDESYEEDDSNDESFLFNDYSSQAEEVDSTSDKEADTKNWSKSKTTPTHKRSRENTKINNTPQISSQSDYIPKKLDLSSSPLHSIHWQRIVLDEAHRIKSRTTSTAQAIFALKSSGTRWCLTGTPLQNRVGELYSLVRFLNFDPYAYYFCSKKGCNCKSLDYKFYDNRYCVHCGHSKMCHYSYFNRKIINPIQKYGYQGEGHKALVSLKKEVLDLILLRRTKEERAKDVNLPKLTVTIRKDTLSKEELDFYQSLYKQSQIEFDTYIQAGTLLHNFAHIFDLLSRLRQAVDHPYLVIHKNVEQTKDKGSDYLICRICQEVAYLSEVVHSRCSHSFHKSCIQEYIDSAPTMGASEELGCPVCYVPLTLELNETNKEPSSPLSTDEQEAELDDTLDKIDQEQAMKPKHSSSKQKLKSIMANVDPSRFTSSTKIEALYQEIQKIQQNDPTSKSIVFSQYSMMLEIVEWRLKKGGINCAKFVGSMSLVSRSNILYAFNQDPDLKVLLISLKAGGEGLNLQIANSIFLMDPWWNPAAEMQAIQRAHRLGQKKPVYAVRFICKDTIEEKILQLQEKKQLVFDGTVGAQSSAIMKLTSEDMKFLFTN